MALLFPGLHNHQGGAGGLVHKLVLPRFFQYPVAKPGGLFLIQDKQAGDGLAWARLLFFKKLISGFSHGLGIGPAVDQGVTPFIMSTANITPSGYPEKSRMIMINPPVPKPKIHLPLEVSGEVTGSVAMKNAPNMRAPPKR